MQDHAFGLKVGVLPRPPCPDVACMFRRVFERYGVTQKDVSVPESAVLLLAPASAKPQSPAAQQEEDNNSKEDAQAGTAEPSAVEQPPVSQPGKDGRQA